MLLSLKFDLFSSLLLKYVHNLLLYFIVCYAASSEYIPIHFQIKLTNPSGTKPLVYQAIVSGFDADDYHVSSENGMITIPPKGKTSKHHLFTSGQGCIL